MKNKILIDWLKNQHYDEDLPGTFSAYKMSDMLYGLGVDYYLETLGTNAGESEETLYLDYYEPIVNAVIMMEDQPREYHFETLEDIAKQLIEWDELYQNYKKKFLPFKK
jgi:hypothetical protein